MASDCESSRWVYHALAKDFEFVAAIIEQPISKKDLFKRRVKKIGYVQVIGQTLFSALVVPWLKRRARLRKSLLVEQYGLKNDDFNITKAYHVTSINDDTCKQLLQQLQPAVVLVNGTRIISKNILQSTPAIFINMHVGITPWYRGSHGGYWALYNKDEANFGTTIHIVDAGIDTGAVLKQVFIRPGKQDNFVTYPVLQVAIGINALKELLPKVLKDNYQTSKHSEKGRMYYQPTIWQYFLRI